MATRPTTPESRARISNIHRPEKIDAHLEVAPAERFSAVCPTGPPTGCPWNRPEPRFPTPCAMKSALASDRVPSSFGADSATPTPCTSTIAATARAPVSNDHETTENGGQRGKRDPTRDGSLVLDQRDACAGHEDDCSRHCQGHHRTEGGDLGLAKATMMAMAASPVSSDGPEIDVGWMITSQAFSKRDRALGGRPGQVRELAGDDVDRHTAQEPDHHRVADEPGEPPEATDAGQDHRRPGDAGEQEEGFRALVESTLSRAEPAASAVLVVVMTMSLVLLVRPPATGPAKLA